MRTIALLCLGALLAACAAPETEETAAGDDALTVANATDDFLATARAAGTVGELPTGYLGIPDHVTVTDDLSRHVADINIKRKAIYFQLAQKKLVTPEQVERTTACVLFRDKIAVGQYYRTEAGAWVKRADETPITLPSFCAELL